MNVTAWLARQATAVVHLDPGLLTLLQVTVCVVATALAARLLRHAMAAERHRMWTAAFLMCAVLLAIAVSRRAAAGTSALELIWAVGVVAVLLRAGLGMVLAARLRRRCRPLNDQPWTRRIAEARAVIGLARHVTLLGSDRVSSAIAFGWLRPVIVLPNDAQTWDDERCRVVLLHELAHLARHDGVVRLVDRLIVALLWFHPLVLWASRRFHVEAERACDEAVIATGIRRSVYASHLLALSAGPQVLGPSGTMAFAHHGRSEIEERVLGALAARTGGAHWGVMLLVAVLMSGTVAASVVASTPAQICPLTGRSLD